MCAVEVDDDGMFFDPKSVKAARIKEAAPALSFDNLPLRGCRLCIWLMLTWPSIVCAKGVVCFVLAQMANHPSHQQVQAPDHWAQPLFPRAHVFGRAAYPPPGAVFTASKDLWLPVASKVAVVWAWVACDHRAHAQGHRPRATGDDALRW